MLHLCFNKLQMPHPNQTPPSATRLWCAEPGQGLQHVCSGCGRVVRRAELLHRQLQHGERVRRCRTVFWLVGAGLLVLPVLLMPDLAPYCPLQASGHFSQLVWKGSTQLGCGYSTKCQMLTCNYSPPGNVAGQFASNVQP